MFFSHLFSKCPKSLYFKIWLDRKFSFRPGICESTSIRSSPYILAIFYYCFESLQKSNEFFNTNCWWFSNECEQIAFPNISPEVEVCSVHVFEMYLLWAHRKQLLLHILLLVLVLLLDYTISLTFSMNMWWGYFKTQVSAV